MDWAGQCGMGMPPATRNLAFHRRPRPQDAVAKWRTYNKRVPGGLSLLLSSSGSGFPRALPFGVLAGVYAALLEQYGDIDGFELFEHTYPFHVIAFITGFGLIFRLNIAYQRSWEARSLTQNMAAKWADAALQVISFDEVAEGEAAAGTPAFLAFVVHAFSLLHATALQSLRGDDIESALQSVPLTREEAEREACTATAAPSAPVPALDAHVSELYRRPGRCYTGGCGGLFGHHKVYPQLEVLGTMAEGEVSALHDSDEPTYLVYTWLLKELVARRKAGGIATDAPVVSRIYQVLSDGMLGYLGARKLADTPFPFPYAQLNAAFCLVNLCVFPAVVAAKVQGIPMVSAIAFLAITMMYSLNEVARELEDPYTAELGSSANRLQGAAMHRDFNIRLLTFYRNSRGGRALASHSVPKTGAAPQGASPSSV